VGEQDLKTFWEQNGDGDFFSKLPKYYSDKGNKAILYQEIKPQVKENRDCHLLLNNTQTLTYSEDLGDVANWRYISNISCYIVVGAALLAFLVYLMMKEKMADTPLSYIIFWFCHLCSVTLAIILVIYGAWTFGQIYNLKTVNKNIYQISEGGCFTDANVNSQFKNFETGLKERYSKIALYAELLIDVSICFLVLEILYLIWYACSYKCRRNIEDEDDEEEK
jgi:hypothetical protein